MKIATVTQEQTNKNTGKYNYVIYVQVKLK